MQSIPLVRASHLLSYIDVLRTVGAPVQRELRRARLPMLLDEVPDSYVPTAVALQFLDTIVHSEGLLELGLLVTERTTFGRLSADLQAALLSAPTLYGRVRRLGEFAAAENTNVRLSITGEGDASRIRINLQDFPRAGGAQYSEWIQIHAVIDIVRSAAGAGWSPLEVTFRSTFRPPAGLYERFPVTRVRTGCDDTSILVPASLLSRFWTAGEAETPTNPSEQAGEVAPAVGRPDFPRALKLALRPYLGEGYPDVDLAAWLAGTSTRTLQRRLAQVGLSYRALVRETRVEAAAEILATPDATVLDAAYAVGYTDPSNFSRAYRQVAGCNPRRPRWDATRR